MCLRTVSTIVVVMHQRPNDDDDNDELLATDRTECVRVAIGHVAVITPDLDRYRRFYEDVLGLRTVSIDRPLGAPYRRLATLTDDAASVAVLAFEVPGYESGLADDVIGRRGRLDHLAFVVDGDRFDEAVGRLVEAGASSGHVEELGPSRSVLFVDPDGAFHNLQTAAPDWRPEPSTDVLDTDLLDRLVRRPRR